MLDSKQNERGDHVHFDGVGWSKYNLQCCNGLSSIQYSGKEKQMLKGQVIFFNIKIWHEI